MKDIEKAVGFGVLVAVCVTLLCLAVAYPIMLIWNYAVVAAIDVANPIGFWHAFWLAWFLDIFVRSSGRSSGK